MLDKWGIGFMVRIDLCHVRKEIILEPTSFHEGTKYPLITVNLFEVYPNSGAVPT